MLSFIRYGRVLRGEGIQIKNSQIGDQDVEIFRDVLIQNSVIGNSSKIYNFSVITNTRLAGNKIGKSCTIGNSTVGKHSYIADFSIVNNTHIGNFCSIGPGFKCGLGSHPHNFISSSPFFYSTLNETNAGLYQEYEDIQIGNDVWIGANVFVKDGVTIGDGAIIAAGAVVLKDVEDYAIMGGIPAKVIRYRHDPAVIASLKKLAWWHKDTEWLKANKAYFQKEISGLEDINDITG